MNPAATIWLGGNSTVLHHPPADARKATTACGLAAPAVHPLPTGVLTTCARCRRNLGL